jgi:hypothetical protein
MEEENKTILLEEENKALLPEENDKIIVDLTPGTKIETKKQSEKKPRNHKLKVRLEGESTSDVLRVQEQIKKEESPPQEQIKKVESPPQEQIKPKRAPPKRKQQTEQEIKPVEPAPKKEEIKEKIKIVKLVNCDKCNKSMTSKSLKYSHKCGEEKKLISNEPKTIEYETEAPTDVSRVQKINILATELNTRVMQRIKEKERRISKLIENAF